MLYTLFNSFSIIDSVIYRCVISFFTAFVLILACGGKTINYLKLHQGKGQPIRKDGPKSHLETKKGTPTMGGLLILGGSVLSVLLWCDLSNPFIPCALIVYLSYALIGFVDDYGKVTKNSSTSLSGKLRLLIEFSLALLITGAISYFTHDGIRFGLSIPYFQDLIINLSWFYIPFAMFVIVGTANSVNLSDGLDGLAGGLCSIAFFIFAIIAYIVGSDFSQFFAITPISLHGGYRRLRRLFVVQCASGQNLYGRHRFFGLRRLARLHCGHHQARDYPGHCRRHFCN